MESVGLENIAGDIEGRWADLAWETVGDGGSRRHHSDRSRMVDRREKRAQLENDPVLSQLRAVRQRNYVVVPFSETILGLRFVDGVERLAAGLQQLDPN